MTRRFFQVFFTFVLRIFFRRIEMHGVDKVPSEGPVLFVLNHPNALIDPGVLLCLAPRPVSFLAKSTLFTTFGVSWLVKGFDSLPIYRRTDEGADPAKNKLTFELTRELLARGGSVGLFPEGTSHSDPSMRRLRSGAARMALGAAAMLKPDGIEVRVVPAGLYYTQKTTFRSELLVFFSDPVLIDPVELDEDFEPPREAVAALTDRIRRELESVTLQAEQLEALHLVEQAERIFSAAAARGEDSDNTLAGVFSRRRRILSGYHALKQSHPDQVEAVIQRVEAYTADVESLGLDVEHVEPEAFTASAVAGYALRSTLALVLLMPIALLGIAIHYPAYRLVRYLSLRFSGSEDDLIATMKLLGGLLFFVLTWAIVATLLFVFLPWPWALGGTLLTLASGYPALVFVEKFERTLDAARGWWVFLTRRGEYARLHDERVAIRKQLLELEPLVASQTLPAGEVDTIL